MYYSIKEVLQNNSVAMARQKSDEYIGSAKRNFYDVNECEEFKSGAGSCLRFRYSWLAS
jgi:hypothetical protein